MLRGLLLFGLLAAACGQARPSAEPLRLWHTFGPDETEALNEDLARLAPGRVRATVLPFGRAHNRIRDVLGRGQADCPDLIRIDATWLPGLAEAGLLAEAPADADWLPEAVELAEWNGRRWGLPQTVDGLVLLFDEARVKAVRATPPQSVEELIALARALAGGGRWALSVRSDGYWFVPWLRAMGGDLPGAARGGSTERLLAMRTYVGLTVEPAVAPRPSLVGDEAAEEGRRFAAGDVAIVVGGPWTLAALIRAGADANRIGIWPFPNDAEGVPAAPRGGHLWAVPACSRRPADAWALASALTAAEVQERWSSRLGVIPTRPRALDGAGRHVRQFVDALAHTRPLPRAPLTPFLFDDLTPALQAAIAREARVEDCMSGVASAWDRLQDPRPLPYGPRSVPISGSHVHDHGEDDTRDRPEAP